MRVLEVCVLLRVVRVLEMRERRRGRRDVIRRRRRGKRRGRRREEMKEGMKEETTEEMTDAMKEETTDVTDTTTDIATTPIITETAAAATAAAEATRTVLVVKYSLVCSIQLHAVLLSIPKGYKEEIHATSTCCHRYESQLTMRSRPHGNPS